MFTRQWMYNRNLPGRKGLTQEFIDGVDEFIAFAISQDERYKDGEKIRCPCHDCRNNLFLIPNMVGAHLYRRGFIDGYWNWTCHGEPSFPVNQEQSSIQQLPDEMAHWGDYEQMNWDQRMVYDYLRPSVIPPFGMAHCQDEAGPSNEAPLDETVPGVEGDDISKLSDRFFDVLKAADEPLYHGCNNHSKLSWVARMLSIKSENNMSEVGFNNLTAAIKEIIPEDNAMPSDYYHHRKVMNELGLPVVKIDACKNGCMLYWKDDEKDDSCKFCNEPRYKQKGRIGVSDGRRRKKVPQSILRYLPLTPRLQRLYASNATAPHMIWHATHETNEGVMCHPRDAEAWKHFDRTYPEFAMDPRNVRLGLCADGFAPHGQFGKTYSCWPVIVTPYNLPPGMCMKSQYMFLSLICPGPKNPKKNIDVFLQPLIDELNHLWADGEITYDVSRNDYFHLRAALMWTINDFPAYGMLSGWSTAGVLGCPICMENSRAFYLQHGKKACYFDCHRAFLRRDHPYRKDKKCFTRGRVESNHPPPRLSGEETFQRVTYFRTAVEDPICPPPDFGRSHKWTKRSIFWDLAYWKNNLIRHNLDVMHIEKNVFDNVFNTVMDVKGKSKDNLNARKDVSLICDRKDISIPPNSTTRDYPKATYTLTKPQRRKILEWISSLRFPDGYASNLSRCVDWKELKLTGMKSHDCHVFMQRLIPIAFREMLPADIWRPLTELSLLFQTICSAVLDINQLRQLEENVAVTLCNLERVLPPSFFDSMEHLVVHLPYEAIVGGPVQYRWMYPFERFLQELKKTIKNKAHIEGSICQAYIAHEINIFAEHYFEANVSCRSRRPHRNDEGINSNTGEAFSIFNYPGRTQGRSQIRWLSDQEFHVAHTYVLQNCPEVQPYYEIFVNYLRGNPPDAIDKAVEQHFAKWFEKYVAEDANQVTDPLLRSLAWGPSKKSTSWPGYFINGYNFQTVDYGAGKSTMNWGVCVQGSNSGDACTDFHGILHSVLQLEYHGFRTMVVTLFDCTWFDPLNGTRVHPIYKLVEVNRKRLYRKYDPFVLAQQATQVYYADFPSMKKNQVDWMVVCKTKARRTVQTSWHEKEEGAFQMEEIPSTSSVVISENIPQLVDPAGIHLTVDISEVLEPIAECESDEEDEEEEFDDYDSEEDFDDNPNEL